MAHQFAAGARAAVPVVLAYLTIGLAAGVVARGAGMSVAEVTLMSLILYAGSAQFAAAGLLGAGTSPPAIVTTIFLINLRHVVHSSALAKYFCGISTRQSVIIGAELTDETFAVASTYGRNADHLTPSWMYGLNITSQVSWLIGNLGGAIVGGMIAKPETFGLHVALPAMFMALLVLQLESSTRLSVSLMVAMLTGGLILALVYILPEGLALLVATLLGATAGIMIDRWIDRLLPVHTGH